MSLRNGLEISLASGLTFIIELLKANMWEVLAIIGACQILIMPLVAASKGVHRWLYWMGVLHVLAIVRWFNYDFVYGRPNWLTTCCEYRAARMGWRFFRLVGLVANDAGRNAGL
ncbi:MAG: hypothetical protein R3C09_15000 [Pirellulaceae bacterium]